MAEERLVGYEAKWDLTRFMGRLKHYFAITDPRAAFVSTQKLYEAKNIMEQYRQSKTPEGMTKEELYKLQHLGSNAAVIFWQWANQSFNALVNYTNRNAKSSLTGQQIGVAYVSATTSALVTSLGLKAFLSKRGGSLSQRFVPLVAVWAANCVNIPLMRQNELTHGIMLTDESNKEIARSKLAAIKAVGLVTISRLVIVTPAMLITPFAMEKLEKALWFQRNRRLLNVPLQAGMTALFWITSKTLQKHEPAVYAEISETLGARWLASEKSADKFYFNKGL